MFSSSPVLFGLLEAPDGEGEHRDSEGEDDQHLGPDRDDPPVDRQGRGIAFAQHHAADGIDPVGRRVQASHDRQPGRQDRKSTRLNSSHITISYAVFCLKKKKKINRQQSQKKKKKNTNKKS